MAIDTPDHFKMLLWSKHKDSNQKYIFKKR